MKLSEWKDGLAAGELAKIADAHGIRLATFYEATRKAPTVHVARRLSKATGGVVSVAEVLGLSADELPKSKKRAA